MAPPPPPLPPALSPDEALARVRRGSAAALLADWRVRDARVVTVGPPVQVHVDLDLEGALPTDPPLPVQVEVGVPLTPDQPADPDIGATIADFQARWQHLAGVALAHPDLPAFLARVPGARATFDPLGANLAGRLVVHGHLPTGEGETLIVEG